MSQALDTLKDLLKVYGPSGNESQIAQCIKEKLEGYADEMYIDNMGSLIAVKRGGEKKIMLAAHMDQNGFMVTYIDDNGFLRITPVGGMNAVTFINSHVVFENGTKGVISYEANGDKLENVSFDRLYIDIGALTREEAEKHVRIGDMAVCVCDIIESEECISAPALDDRAGCAVLLEAFKRAKESPYTVYAAFTVQEEVGCRGAKPATYSLEPDIAVAIDVTLSCDTPKAKLACSCVLGKGPAIKIKDSGSIAHPKVRRWLADAARVCGYAVQNEVLSFGGTDASQISVSRGGVPAGTLSIPTRYVHSTVEMIHKRDFEQSIDMLSAALYQEY